MLRNCFRQAWLGNIGNIGNCAWSASTGIEPHGLGKQLGKSKSALFYLKSETGMAKEAVAENWRNVVRKPAGNASKGGVGCHWLQHLFFTTIDRCCFPWMCMLCTRSCGQAYTGTGERAGRFQTTARKQVEWCLEVGSSKSGDQADFPAEEDAKPLYRSVVICEDVTSIFYSTTRICLWSFLGSTESNCNGSPWHWHLHAVRFLSGRPLMIPRFCHRDQNARRRKGSPVGWSRRELQEFGASKVTQRLHDFAWSAWMSLAVLTSGPKSRILCWKSMQLWCRCNAGDEESSSDAWKIAEAPRNKLRFNDLRGLLGPVPSRLGSKCASMRFPRCLQKGVGWFWQKCFDLDWDMM